jgi:hypothetical protein
MDKMLIWDKSAKVFEKWMNKTLEIKDEGEAMNKIKPKSGEALRNFGKTLGNSSYGQTIKKDQVDSIQFINGIESKNKYMDENELKEIIFNDDDLNEAYHVFIGKKIIDETKNLSTRSRFLGAFVLAYSRQMLDDIVNCIYGENRFRKEGISNKFIMVILIQLLFMFHY